MIHTNDPIRFNEAERIEAARLERIEKYDRYVGPCEYL